MRQNQKLKIPHTVLERSTMCISSYKSCKLQSKTMMSLSLQNEKECIFVTFCPKEISFDIWVLSQCLVCSIV